MKKVLMTAAVVMLVLAMAGVSIAAITTGTTTVNANVTGKCGAITGSTITLTIDPSAGAATSAGSSTTVQCSKNFAPVSVSAESFNAGVGSLSTSGTMNGTLSDGTNTIPYALTFTSAFTGNGFGANAPTTLVAGTGASVTALNAASAIYSGVQYSDSVTITVTY